MNKSELIEKIKKLKEEKDAIILAHYYVDGDVQDIADYVGDSFFLAKKAKETNNKMIVFCGVSFMGESAKILNPNKKVLVPDMSASCPMASMVNEETIRSQREKYDDLAVVCYINSDAKIKALSDVIVTSSNAIKIVQNIKEKNIFFIPDKNLGRFVKDKVLEKNIILNDGYCPIHNRLLVSDINLVKSLHPNALVLVHPECPKAICDMADFIGSTKEIIEYCQSDDHDEYIIGTEEGVLHQLKKNNPNKMFYLPRNFKPCMNMKKITLENVYSCLLEEKNEVILSEELIEKAKKPLDRMLEMGK